MNSYIWIHIWIHVTYEFIWFFHRWIHMFYEFIYEFGCTKVPDVVYNKLNVLCTMFCNMLYSSLENQCNTYHNRLHVLHSMLYMIQIWCPSPTPPPTPNALARGGGFAANWKFIYSSSGRPSASTPFERPPRQWPRPSMVLLGCLCHSLLKMNAQDEKQWWEIHAKAIIRVIIKLKV